MKWFLSCFAAVVLALCSAHAWAETLKLYWSDTTDQVIRRSNLDGTDVEVVLQNAGSIAGLAIDTTNEWIYWTDRSAYTINRARYDGTAREVLIADSVIARSVGLDVAGGTMYWGDQSPGTLTPEVRRANLDGSGMETLVSAPDVNVPTILALDLLNEHLYWSDFGRGRISRSNLDGSDVQPVVSGLGDPIGIALDVADERIYWAEDGDPTTSPAFQRARLDGSEIETLISVDLDRPSGIAVDVVGQKFYWSDWGAGTIGRADLDGSNLEILHSGQAYPRQLILAPDFVIPEPSTLIPLIMGAVGLLVYGWRRRMP